MKTAQAGPKHMKKGGGLRFERTPGVLATFKVYNGDLLVDTVYRDSAKYTADGIKHLLVSKGGFPSSIRVERVM